jgi:hypothetical protein
MHILVVHAMIILLNYGPGQGMYCQKVQMCLFYNLLHLLQDIQNFCNHFKEQINVIIFVNMLSVIMHLEFLLPMKFQHRKKHFPASFVLKIPIYLLH